MTDTQTGLTKEFGEEFFRPRNDVPDEEFLPVFYASDWGFFFYHDGDMNDNARFTLVSIYTDAEVPRQVV